MVCVWSDGGLGGQVTVVGTERGRPLLRVDVETWFYERPCDVLNYAISSR